MALILGGILLSATWATAAAPKPLWNARYEVTFGESNRGVPQADVEVTLACLRKGACPATVELAMAEDGFPAGYAAFVRGPVTFPARLPVPVDGIARLRYEVVLEHDATGWDPGPDEAPYSFDGGAFWTGRALFATAEGSRVNIVLHAPEGRRISTSLEPGIDEERLRDSFLVVGTHEEARLRVGDARVTLALGGKLAGSMPIVEGAIRRFLDASERIFGGAPPARILVAGNVGASAGSLFGGVFGSDVSFLADEPLDAGNSDRWRPFLCHEIFHLWNGTTIDFPAGQQYWFTEGATEYYAHLLPVRLGEAGGENFLKTLTKKSARYLETERRASLVAAGNEKFLSQALVYDGGALAALVLDLKIREATANRRSMDDLLRALYRTARDRKGRGLGFEDVAQATSKVAGKPMDEFFRRHIAGTAALPLAEALRVAGLEIRSEVIELPETMTVLGDLLRSPSVTVTQEGLRVNVTDSEVIRAGDTIAAVEGAPIRTFEALRRAFKDRGRGSKVRLSIVRDGAPADIEVTLAGVIGDPIETSRHAEVSIVPLPEAEASALAIRASLLGRIQ